MALLASGHTALETVSQIGITNFVEGGDDLLLNGVCHFHFALCRHARIYAARNSEPGFSGKCGWSSWRWGCRTGLEPCCGNFRADVVAGLDLTIQHVFGFRKCGLLLGRIEV